MMYETIKIINLLIGIAAYVYVGRNYYNVSAQYKDDKKVLYVILGIVVYYFIALIAGVIISLIFEALFSFNMFTFFILPQICTVAVGIYGAMYYLKTLKTKWSQEAVRNEAKIRRNNTQQQKAPEEKKKEDFLIGDVDVSDLVKKKDNYRF